MGAPQSKLLSKAAMSPRICTISESPPGGAAMVAEPRPAPVGAALVHRAVAHLESNYMEPVTLHDLACETGHSSFQIIRAFRRETGTTPHAFLMQLRVLRAATLLASGEPIIGVAAEAGFADQSHFTRHFKRVFGMTPGRFRRLHLQPAGDMAVAGAARAARVDRT